MRFNFLLCSEQNLHWIQSNCTKKVNPCLPVERMWFAYINANDLYLSNIQLKYVEIPLLWSWFSSVNSASVCLKCLMWLPWTFWEREKWASHIIQSLIWFPSLTAMQNVWNLFPVLYHLYIYLYRCICRCSKNIDILCSSGLISIF